MSKLVKLSKNPIQKLYEIKAVQPLNYELISEQGPAHEKLFNYLLKFKLNNKLIGFYGNGSSKQIAKKFAAMNALYYLIKLPNSILDEIEIDNIKSILYDEVRSIGFDTKNINIFFNQNENRPVIFF